MPDNDEERGKASREDLDNFHQLIREKVEQDEKEKLKMEPLEKITPEKPKQIIDPALLDAIKIVFNIFLFFGFIGLIGLFAPSFEEIKNSFSTILSTKTEHQKRIEFLEAHCTKIDSGYELLNNNKMTYKCPNGKEYSE